MVYYPNFVLCGTSIVKALAIPSHRPSRWFFSRSGMYKTLRIGLGLILLVGPFFGVLRAIEKADGYIEDDGNWLFGGMHILYAIAFIYICVIGFKLIANKSDVIKQAKWIFLLQVPYVSIYQFPMWSWSTGIDAGVGYLVHFGFVAGTQSIHEARANFHILSGDTGVAVNLAALALAWLAHKLSKQLDNATTMAETKPRETTMGKHEAPTPTVLRSLTIGKMVLKNIMALVVGVLMGGLVYAVLSEFGENSSEFINNYKFGAVISLVTMLVLVMLGIPLGMVLRKFKLVNWVNSLFISLILCSIVAIFFGLLDYNGNVGQSLDRYVTATFWGTFFSCCMAYTYFVGLPIYGTGKNFDIKLK